MITLILNLVIYGLLKGGIYSIIAMGLSLQYGVARIFNIAYGEFIFLGALSSFILFVIFKLNPLVSLAICSPVFFLIGFFLHKTIFRKLADLNKSSAKFETKSLLATFSLFFIIQYLAPGGTLGVKLDYLKRINLGEISFRSDLLATLIIALIIGFVFYLFLARTHLGKTIRATTQDITLAKIIGVDVNRVLAICFGLGTVLAAIAGFLISICNSAIQKNSGMEYTFIAIIIVVLGGLGSIPGCIIASLILGVIGSLVGYFRTDIYPITNYIIFILLLVIRPRGIMGK